MRDTRASRRGRGGARVVTASDGCVERAIVRVLMRARGPYLALPYLLLAAV